MSKLISKDYQQLNTELHRSGVSYGTFGARFAPHAAHLVKKYGATSLLDYGCGKGTLKAALKRFCPDLDIREYDPAIPGKAGKPKPVDATFCSDVMEHIEPDYLDAVLAHIAEITRKIAWMCISTVPAVKNLSDGRNAHLIVEPPAWWLAKVSSHMDVERHKIDDSDSGAVIVWARPKGVNQ